MKLAKNTPSQKSQVIETVLNKAIAAALEKKHRLGQYAVFWEDDKVVYRGDDAPRLEQKQD
ncbi:hypothetical protein [Methylotuvimicrobium sp. KM1]|uniref:hypothetical protein n=1 Tax=Methylotuvimicrobium sp. KM1 TaxID=3377707 RepID=UPI00384F71FE